MSTNKRPFQRKRMEHKSTFKKYSTCSNVCSLYWAYWKTW